MNHFGQGRSKLTQAQLDRLKRLYETHGTFAAVTAITGACKETLRKYKALGWVIQPDPKTIPTPTDLALNASKMSIKQLRVHYGLSQAPLYRMLREQGIKRDYRSKRVYEPIPRPPASLIVAVIREKGVEGAAAHFGVDPNTFRRWRRDYGLPINHKRKKAKSYAGWAEHYFDDRRAA